MVFLRNTDISKKETEASLRLLKCKEQKEKELYWRSWKVLLNRVVAVESILGNPRDCSLPGFSVIVFPRQEYGSGLPFPSPGDLPDPGIEPSSPALAGGFFTTEPSGKPLTSILLRQELNSILICFQQHLGNQMQREVREGRGNHEIWWET